MSETERMPYWERLGIPNITLKEFKEQVRISWHNKQVRGVNVAIGEAGIGKTEAIEQLRREFSEEAGYEIPLVVVHSAHYALQGAGLPMKIEGRADRFQHALPSWFPDENQPRGILDFDEFNQAPKHVVDMLFSMLEGRRLHEGVLPEGWIIVVGMNPANENYSVTKIEQNAALRRRVKLFYIAESAADWFAYAETPEFHHRDSLDKPCHPDILSWVQKNPQEYLHNTMARDNGKQYPCPATLQTISLDMWLLAKAGISTYGNTAKARYAASIGEQHAEILCNYVRDNSVLLDPNEVLTTYAKAPKLRAHVKKLLGTVGQQARILELNGALATTLYIKKTPPAEIADNLVTYISDIPKEQLQGFFNQLYAESKADEGGPEYLRKLAQELQTHSGWRELSKKHGKAFLKAKEAYEGNSEAKDPLE